jgi:hypothetical protein
MSRPVATPQGPAFVLGHDIRANMSSAKMADVNSAAVGWTFGLNLGTSERTAPLRMNWMIMWKVVTKRGKEKP